MKKYFQAIIKDNVKKSKQEAYLEMKKSRLQPEKKSHVLRTRLKDRSRKINQAESEIYYDQSTVRWHQQVNK